MSYCASTFIVVMPLNRIFTSHLVPPGLSLLLVLPVSWHLFSGVPVFLTKLFVNSCYVKRVCDLLQVDVILIDFCCADMV